MNINVHQRRLVALIQQRMASGRFASIEDALVQALEAAPLPPEPQQSGETGAEHAEASANVRGLFTDEEIEQLFPCNPTATRTGLDLLAAMQAMPHKETDIEPSRPRMPVRDVTL